MLDKIDLNKINIDRFPLLTISRKINEVIEYINNMNAGSTISEMKISDGECGEVNNKLLDNKNEVDLSTSIPQNDNNSNTNEDEEIKRVVQEKIKESVDDNPTTKRRWIAQKNKNGNTIIRKSWGSVDKHME